MKRDNLKITILVVGIAIVLILSVLMLRSANIRKNTITPTNYRVLVINPRTGDTLMDKSVNSLNPMTLDSLTMYLNKR